MLSDLGSADLDRSRRASDPAFWSVSRGWPTTWPRERLGTPQPVTNASPYADLLANACGKEIMERSWWVTLCPGPCQDPAVARAAALTGYLFLVKRNGHWLVWAAK
ncbi:MAG TPA: hypothetical protein VG370_05215 [Chloroflexota bacterium]|nr:hypothetical protein [Chloroflexota bacterium]